MMSLRSTIAVWLGLLAVSVAARGQAPATQPTSTARPESTVVIPELVVPGNSVTVAKFLPLLKEKAPSFQFVAYGGRWQEFVLPPLNLRNVTVSQVVELLRELVPRLSADQNRGSDSNSSFWVFRDLPAPAGAGGTTRLVAFGLNDPIDRLALRKAWSVTAFNEIAPAPEQIASSRSAALKEILSLLEAAMEQSAEPGPAPSLKLHEETGVLLVKGTVAQINAVSQALDALKSGDDPNQLRVKYNRLTTEYERARSGSQEAKRDVTRLESQIRVLREQNAALERKLRPLSPMPMTQPGNTSGDGKH